MRKNISDGNEKVFCLFPFLSEKQTWGIVKIWTELQLFIISWVYFLFIKHFIQKYWSEASQKWHFFNPFFVYLNTPFLCEQIAIRMTNLATKCLHVQFHLSITHSSLSYLKWQIWDERFMQIWTMTIPSQCYKNVESIWWKM